ncbi:MAG TPA: hypothetical protein VMW48_04700, partial [Vicinamibacterales bacterium]|nr:hypothetical protein [Vicinamibacterales bacterium]
MRMHLSLITRVLTTCLVATAAARPAGAQGLTALAANRGQAAAPATPSSWVDDNIYRRAIADGGRIWSMGQPPLLRWQAGVTADTRKSAGLAVVGAQKGFLNPLAGVMAVRAEGVIGASDQGLEGGGRLLAVSPLARMHFGLDYDVRDNRANWLIGTEFNIRRGGIFGRGTRLRLDWIPGRDALQVGVVMPVRQFAGRTRPSSDKARVQAARPRAVRPGAALAVATREFRAAADAVTRLVMPMRTRLGGDAVQAVAPDVAAVQALGRSDEVLSRMVAAWPRLFRAAAADQGVEGTA